MTRQDISFVRGDDYSLRFRLVPPQDLTGCSLALHARDSDDELVLALSDEAGEIEIQRDHFIVHFPHEKTQGADWERANYDIQLIDSQNKRRTLVMGKIKLIVDQTRI